MSTSLDYFNTIFAFGRSRAALLIVLGANLAFTAVHIWEEARGERAPLYRVFGGIVGVCLPKTVGIAIFTVLLGAVQGMAGLVAYTGLPRGQSCLAFGVGALGFVLGARIGDSVISHWTVFLEGFRPNPGLRSTVLYVLEFVGILIMFQPGLRANTTAALVGLTIGIGLFLSVLPLMAIAGLCIKSWQRPRWVREGEMPTWVLDPD